MKPLCIDKPREENQLGQEGGADPGPQLCTRGRRFTLPMARIHLCEDQGLCRIWGGSGKLSDGYSGTLLPLPAECHKHPTHGHVYPTVSFVFCY